MALAGKCCLEGERARLHEAERRLDTGAFGRCLLCAQDSAVERLEYTNPTPSPASPASAAKSKRPTEPFPIFSVSPPNGGQPPPPRS